MDLQVVAGVVVVGLGYHAVAELVAAAVAVVEHAVALELRFGSVGKTPQFSGWVIW